MFHGIIVNKSLRDLAWINRCKCFAQKQFTGSDWVVYGLEVPENQIEEVIQSLQQNMKEGTWYAHFYQERKMIVVFNDKIFRVTIDPKTWQDLLAYGKFLDIPPEQLDFWPNRIEDEEKYFSSET